MTKGRDGFSGLARKRPPWAYQGVTLGATDPAGWILTAESGGMGWGLLGLAGRRAGRGSDSDGHGGSNGGSLVGAEGSGVSVLIEREGGGGMRR